MAKEKRSTSAGDIVRRGPYEIGPDADGRTRLLINTAQLPVPDRRFVAQSVAVQSAAGSIVIVFGQRMAQRLCSALALQLEPRGLEDFYRSLTPAFRSSVHTLLSAYPSESPAQCRLRGDEIDAVAPDRFMTYQASLGVLYVSSGGCSFDWYSIHNRALHNAKRGDGPIDPPEPVVQVYCSIPVVALFLKLLDDLVGTRTGGSDEEKP